MLSVLIQSTVLIPINHLFQYHTRAQLGHKHQPQIILYIALVLSTRTCHAVVAKCNFPTIPWLDTSYPLYSDQSVISRNLYGIATVSWCSLPLFCNKEYCHLSKLTATAHRVHTSNCWRLQCYPNSSMDMESVVVSFTTTSINKVHTSPCQHTFPWKGTQLMERNKLWGLLPQIYS